MKRALAIASVLLAAAALAVFATGAGDAGGYKVRAIFNNAAFVIKGEDVKIAGVKVGLQLTHLLLHLLCLACKLLQICGSAAAHTLR